MPVDPYYTLGIPPDASEDEVKRAYRQKVMHLHPDHNTNPDADEAFRAVKDAYNLIISGEWADAHPTDPEHPDPGYNAPRNHEEFVARREAARDRSRMAMWEKRLQLLKDRNQLQKSGFYYPALLAFYGLYVGIWGLAAILLSVPFFLSWQFQAPLLLLLVFAFIPVVWRIGKRAQSYRSELAPYFKR